MHRVLINNYNASVPVNGICYFLGDMGLTDKDTLKEIISKLNGTKILILGNHDKKHNAMYNIGFDAVLNGAMLFIAGEKVTLSHCPLKGLFREDATKMKGYKEGDNWHGETKHKEYSFQNEDQFHLHGHCHASPEHKILGKQYDVGVRANHYRPVSISEIESFIALYQKKLNNIKTDI